jgi:hypothetical protein
MMRNNFSIPAAIVLLLATASVHAELNCAGGMDTNGNECMQPSTVAAQPAPATKHSKLQRSEIEVQATKASLHSQPLPMKKSLAFPVQIAQIVSIISCAGHSGATGNYCD